jgi:UDP-N-acetylmuramoylalanine--D-glutamate ligase
MNIAILGFDVEGRASFEYFRSLGYEITIHDRNSSLVVPEGIKSVLGDNYLDNLDQYELLVRTPGLHPRQILEKNPSVKDKITTHANEFFRVCPTKNIIGVTGTKGKGTTSTLTMSLIEATGKKVRLGGNLGVPPLTFLSELDESSWVVLELSNFQLIDLKYSPHIAVCLGVVEEHLDWHGSMDEYVRAKSSLFAQQTGKDIAIYYSENEVSKRIASSGKGSLLPFFSDPGAFVHNDSIVIGDKELCKTSELILPGKHNWQNVCAAVTAVWQVSKDVEIIHSVLKSFPSLEHRIEFVREKDGISYYNDSYASGLQATEAAIEAIDAKKVMILGGYDRMLNINDFGPYCFDHSEEFRSLLLIGASAKRLASVLDDGGVTNYVMRDELNTMDEVVKTATSLAKPGDAVVLSPGFASFDMFKNFSERGKKFKEAVEAL